MYTSKPMTSTLGNQATNLTQPGGAGYNWFVSYVGWEVSGAALGATALDVAITDGSDTIYQSHIPGNSPIGTKDFVPFHAPLAITAGNAVAYTIDSSGANDCLITANAGFFTKGR